MNLHFENLNTVGLISPLINLDNIFLTTDKKEHILDVVELIALQALNAITSFKGKKLFEFDPSIGDEACQIRTLMMLQFANQDLGKDLNDGIDEFQNLNKKIKEIRSEFIKLDEEVKKQKKMISVKVSAQRELFNQETKNLLKKSEAYKNAQSAFKQKSEKIKQVEEIPLDQQLDADKLQVLQSSFLEVKMMQSVRQIILCYILAKVKHQEVDVNDPHFIKIHDKFHLKNLQIGEVKIDGKLLEPIICKAKELLNLESINFLQDESCQLLGKRASVIQALMHKPLPSQKENFKEVSFYHTVEFILKRAKAQNFPVLIKSRDPAKDPFVFTCKQLFVVQDGEKKTFVPASSKCINQPIMVIEGVSQCAEEKGLMSVVGSVGGLMKMVLYNASLHRFCTKQSPEPKDADPTILRTLGDFEGEIFRIHKKQKNAIILGSIKNSDSQFIIEHIFADMLDNQI